MFQGDHSNRSKTCSRVGDKRLLSFHGARGPRTHFLFPSVSLTFLVLPCDLLSRKSHFTVVCLVIGPVNAIEAVGDP